MSDIVEFTGKSTEEALAKAQAHFGLPLNRLEVEVVSAGSSGLFGLLGAKKAKVRVRALAGSIEQEMAELAAVVSEQVQPRLRPAPRPAEPAPAPQAEAAPAPKPAAPALAMPLASVPAPSAPAAAPAPAPQAQPLAPEPVFEELEEEAALEETELEQAEGEEAEAGPGEDEEEEEFAGEGRLEQDPATIDHAREVLARLVAPLDPEATVEAKGSPQGIWLEVVTREAGVLIGRRGQNLEALQYLTTRIVSHRVGKPVRLSVDAGGYRLRRREALEDLAHRVAAKAKSSGRSVSIGPLSAPERRVVHMTLKNEPGISTNSRGRGELKKVIISAKI